MKVTKGRWSDETELPEKPFATRASRGSLPPDVFIDAGRAPQMGRACEERPKKKAKAWKEVWYGEKKCAFKVKTGVTSHDRGRLRPREGLPQGPTRERASSTLPQRSAEDTPRASVE